MYVPPTGQQANADCQFLAAPRAQSVAQIAAQCQVQAAGLALKAARVWAAFSTSFRGQIRPGSLVIWPGLVQAAAPGSAV